MDMVEFLQVFLLTSGALLLASLSGLLSEKTGIVNISIEGTMVMGATTYLWMMSADGANMYEAFGASSVLLAMFVAGLVGSIFGLILALVSIKFMGDQVIIGTALNLLAPVLFLVVNVVSTGSSGPWIFNITIDQMFEWYSAVIFSLIVVIAIIIWFVLNKTSIGLRVKTTGENPYALETAGISVSRTRFGTLFVSGILAGMAGAVFMMTSGNTIFTGTVYGYGFIAIAIVIFGQWKVEGAFIGAILISALLSFISVGFNAFEVIQNYQPLFQMIPFVVPILALMLLKSRGAPKALGKPFNKSNRE